MDWFAFASCYLCPAHVLIVVEFLETVYLIKLSDGDTRKTHARMVYLELRKLADGMADQFLDLFRGPVSQEMSLRHVDR